MSDIDKKALEATFKVWKNERVPDESDSEAFERFSVEQILKDEDLSDDEFETGHFGGQDDGGVDAMYFFVNRVLVQEGTDIPNPALSAELVIVQAKRDKSFSEQAVEKVYQFTRDMLDYATPVDDLTYLNSLARDCIARFRETYEGILGSQHTFTVTFHYAIDGDLPPNPKVRQRTDILTKFVNETISAANVSMQFWDCRRLLEAARSVPSRQFTLKTTEQFATSDSRAVVCLVQLQELAAFLTDEKGNQRKSLLESNVRAYQGNRNQVNQDIRGTLDNITDKEFWWFNNGITILADDYSFTGPNLVIRRPQIVNGLQTSQEIFGYRRGNSRDDKRNVLIRVVVPPDEATRNRIIKATNFQTAVAPVSLHATDQLHFDIEDRFKLYGLFYDRRKGEYRDERKPISQIVSIPTLAKAVIAILLQRPNDARARPGNLLKEETEYDKVFNASYNRDLYVACILIDRRVQAYMKAKSGEPNDVRRDLQYYVAMMVATTLAKKSALTPTDVSSLFQVVQAGIPDEVLAAAFADARAVYKQLGGTAKVSKGADLVARLRQKIESQFS